MLTKVDKDWAIAAAKRAVRTFAQTAVAVIGVNGFSAGFGDINWGAVFSIAGVSFVLSLLTSLGGLPETPTDGTIIINTTDPNKDTYNFEVGDLDALASKNAVTLKVVSE